VSEKVSKEQLGAFADLVLAAQGAIDWYPEADAAPPYMSGIVEAVLALATHGVRVTDTEDGPRVFIERGNMTIDDMLACGMLGPGDISPP
jgi:hypothetical protein